MVFKNIEISNFKGIKKLKIDNFNLINVFFGNNGSGKTSILETLFLACDPTNPMLLINITHMRRYSIAQMDDLIYYFYNMNPENNSIKIVFNNEDNCSIEINLKDNITKVSNLDTKNYFKKCINYVYKTHKKHEEPINNESNLFAYNSNQQISQNYQGINVDFMTFEIEGNKKIDQIRSEFQDLKTANQTGIYISQIKKNKEIKKLITFLNKFEPNIKDIEVINNTVFFDIEGYPKLLPPNLCGDGILKYINIISSILANNNSVLFIDEIENGLHYSKIKELWSIIFQSAIEFNVQIFITTHNIEILTYLSKIFEENEIFKKKGVCFKVSKIQEETKVYTITAEILKDYLQTENEIR